MKTWRRVGGVLLVALSLAAVAQSCRATSAQQSYVECQARYNEVNNQRTRALTEATDLERAATRRVQSAEADLWLNPRIVRQPGKPVDPSVLADFQELQAALTAWRSATAAADRDRQEHPVPPPPSALCG